MLARVSAVREHHTSPCGFTYGWRSGRNRPTTGHGKTPAIRVSRRDLPHHGARGRRQGGFRGRRPQELHPSARAGLRKPWLACPCGVLMGNHFHLLRYPGDKCRVFDSAVLREGGRVHTALLVGRHDFVLVGLAVTGATGAVTLDDACRGLLYRCHSSQTYGTYANPE